MVGVGDQQDRRSGRGNGDDLPHQSAGIDHSLADTHAFAAAGIQHQPLARGVEVDVQDRRKLHIQPPAFDAVQQAAQACILGRSGLHPRVAGSADQQRVAQPVIVARQLGAGHRILAQSGAQPRRQPRQPPHRLHRHFSLAARRLQPLATVVQHHQHHRQHQVSHQSQHAGDVTGAGCGRSGVRRHVSRSACAVKEGCSVEMFGVSTVWPKEGPTQTIADRLRSAARTTFLLRGFGVGHGWPTPNTTTPARRTRCHACRPTPAHAHRREQRRSADRRQPARAGRSLH